MVIWLTINQSINVGKNGNNCRQVDRNNNSVGHKCR